MEEDRPHLIIGHGLWKLKVFLETVLSTPHVTDGEAKAQNSLVAKWSKSSSACLLCSYPHLTPPTTSVRDYTKHMT